MGYLSNIVAVSQRRAAAFDERFWPELLTAQSKTGISVTVDKALQASAFLACIKVITEDVGQVSRDLFAKRKDGGSDVAAEHPLRDLLVYGPNEWQTGMEFLEQLVLHVGAAGRFMAFKNVVRGQVRELIPFEPSHSRLEVEPSGQHRFWLRSFTTGEEKEFPPEAVWHVKGMSWDGRSALEPIRLARESIGLSLAAEESHALMHANGAQTHGVYSVDGKLNAKQYGDLRKWIEDNQVGANRYRPMVLDNGAKWFQTSMSGVDAQHLETRKFQIEEVCRVLRVLPIMIGYSDKTATFASSAEMFAAHVKYTLGAWFARIEGSVNKNLLSADDRKQGIYFKFLPISLLRGNAKDRGEFYWRMWQMGALNANEIRAYEELNPYEGGDVYRVPVNTQPSDREPADDDEDEAARPPGRRLNVGRVLSGRNERRIRDADSLLNEVLDELDKEPQE